MEPQTEDFGTGLLSYVSRNPEWVLEEREPIRVPYVEADDSPSPARRFPIEALPLLLTLLLELPG